MSTAIQGQELLEFIEKLGELEWTKYETRYPEILIKGGSPIIEDRSDRPPYFSFRFKCDDVDVIEKLQGGVKNYRGNVQWIMDGHRRDSFPGTINWTIHPKKMADNRRLALDAGLTPGQYMAKVDPMFGPLAYDDLVNLTAYLREALQK